MLDAIAILSIAALTALSIAYVYGCEHLKGARRS